MLGSLSFKAYHRYKLEQQLRLVLPSAAAVEAALLSVDHVATVTELPYQDISEPYLQMILSGWVGGPAQLLKLVDCARRLNWTFSALVEWLLEWRQRSGHDFTSLLSA